MFCLKELPNQEMIARMQQDFPQLEAAPMMLCIRLLMLGSELLVRLDKVLGQFDLGHGRWVVLMLLRRREVWRALPSELADEQGVTRATMSGLIRRLEQQGLVRRRLDPEDGRRNVVELTDAGAEVVSRALPRCYALAEEAMSRLRPEEKTGLLALLQKIVLVDV